MIITSHYMEDIKSMCERIVILRKGAVVYDGPLAHIVSDHAPHKIIKVLLDESNGRADFRAALPPALGSLAAHREKLLEFRVPREAAAETAAHLLKTLPIEDLSISEPDIGSVIESIMKEDG